MRTVFIFTVAAFLSACSTTGSVGSDGRKASGERGGILGSIGNVLGGDTIKGQITQCFSEGGTDAVIAYPSGWSRRVSRAETEDELLGGAGESVATSGDIEPQGAVDFVYPHDALTLQQEGICEIKLNVSRRGAPSNVLAACSDPMFTSEAERAVSAASFKPVRVNGAIARGVNATYEMKFCLADE